MNNSFAALLAQANPAEQAHAQKLAELKQRQVREKAKERAQDRANLLREQETRALELRLQKEQATGDSKSTRREGDAAARKTPISKEEARLRRSVAEEERKKNKPKPMTFQQLMSQASKEGSHDLKIAPTVKKRASENNGAKVSPLAGLNKDKSAQGTAKPSKLQSTQSRHGTDGTGQGYEAAKLPSVSGGKGKTTVPSQKTKQAINSAKPLQRGAAVPEKAATNLTKAPLSARAGPSDPGRQPVKAKPVKGDTAKVRPKSSSKISPKVPKDDEIDYREEIWKIFGRKRPEYNDADFSDDDMEVTGAELFKEEQRAQRQARLEDEEEERKEKEHALAKQAKKKRKMN